MIKVKNNTIHNKKTITREMQHKFWMHDINPITGGYAAGKPMPSIYDATATISATDEHRFRNSQRR